MILTVVAALAWIGALLFAAADGAVLGMEDDDGPLPPDAAVIVERRERSHRALAFARILCQLTAGAAVALLWRRAGADWSSAPLLAGTALAVIIGESLARTSGDVLGATVLSPLAWLVRLAEFLLAPVVTIGTWLDAALERLLPARQSVALREAEVEQFREVVEAEADPTPQARGLIRGVFALGDTQVQEIMVPRVEIVGIEQDAPWSEVVDRVRSARHARLVVYGESLDEVIGILYAKDLLPAVLAGDPPEGGWQALVRPALYIPANKRVDDQLREFRTSHRHIAVVLDEFGGTAGLVTLEDALELIVGDIRDENDVEEPEIVSEQGVRYWVSARVSLDDLSAATGHPFERDEVSTVGGLVYELFGRAPRAGERVEAEGFRFVVERVVRRRVARVHLERIGDEHAEGHDA